MNLNSRRQSFNDRMNMLFGNQSSLKINGSHAYSITMQVTDDCNLRCTYCYQHNKSPRKMSFETGKRFIDLILASDERSSKYIKSRECAGVSLEFIGGEPLLEIDLIDKLTDYFIERMIELDHPWLNRYRISICSNGMLYFNTKVQDYIRKHDNHLSFSITVDGNKEQHDRCRIDLEGNGSYDRAMEAVKHYESMYKRKIGTKVTISPDNVALCGQAIIDFIKAEEPEINANCVYEKGWSPIHATILYSQLKDVADYLLENKLFDNYVSILDQDAGNEYPKDSTTWCGGSGLMIAVDASGDIYPCLRYSPSSMGCNQELLKIGDVERGFIYNEKQEQILEAFKSVTRCSQCEKTVHCKDCPIASGCGDCAAYSYETYGEIGRRTTYHCDMHKARVLAQVYYWNKRAKLDNRFPKKKMNCPKDWALPIIGEVEYNTLLQLSNEVD